MRQLSDAEQWILTRAVLLALCAVLSACHAWLPNQVEPSVSPLPLFANRASDSTVQAAEKRLTNQGVRLITQGDDYLISLPASALFYTHSPRLRWQSYPLLNDIADYLRIYRKVSVQVTAFSNPYRSVKRDVALTRARATTVANYLWSQGINARFIYAYGAGRDQPMNNQLRRGDYSLNSRIEITFREAII